MTGQDHEWFVDQVYRNSHTFDYGIERLASEHIAWRGLNDTNAFEEQTLDKLYRTTVVAGGSAAASFRSTCW